MHNVCDGSCSLADEQSGEILELAVPLGENLLFVKTYSAIGGERRCLL